MTKTAAIFGMIAGALTVIVWKQLEDGVFDIYELLPGFIVSRITIVVVSKFTKLNSNGIINVQKINII